MTLATVNIIGYGLAKLRRLNQIQSKLVQFNQKLVKIEIHDTILTLKSESLSNHSPNLLEYNFESLTIRFGSPNHLSLGLAD